MERLREMYEQRVRAQLRERFGYANVNQIPKLEKVVVNMSVGEAIVNDLPARRSDNVTNK